MSANSGVIEMRCPSGLGGVVDVQIFYDGTVSSDPTLQPLIETGSPLAAMLCVNSTPATCRLVMFSGAVTHSWDLVVGTTAFRLTDMQALGVTHRSDARLMTLTGA